MGAVIRELRPEDRTAVEEMLAHCGAFNHEEIRVAMELFDAGVNAGYFLFGMEEAGKLQGYVCLGKASLTQSSWYIFWICVHPSAQHQGVGRALQMHSEQFVRSQGGRRMVLETSGRLDYERARIFYQNAGYTRVGQIRDFYKPGDDCLIYVKKLE